MAVQMGVDPAVAIIPPRLLALRAATDAAPLAVIIPPVRVLGVPRNVLLNVRVKRPKPAQTVQQGVTLVVEMTAITHALVSVEESVEHHAVEHVRVSVGTEVAK